MNTDQVVHQKKSNSASALKRFRKSEWRPVLSIILITVTLLTIVFFKMEVRRLGYVIVKKSRELKELEDSYRVQDWKLSKLTRLDHVREMAESKLTLNSAKRGQIIHMSGSQIAFTGQ